MNTIRSKGELIKELQDKEIRDFFVSEHIDIGLSAQIRILRKQRGWTQKDLADRLGKKQPWVNKIENNYSGFSLQTLKDLASVFDVALIVRFAPFGELVKWELELSPESLNPPSFDKDPYFTISSPKTINLTTSCAVASTTSDIQLDLEENNLFNSAAASANINSEPADFMRYWTRQRISDSRLPRLARAGQGR